MPKDTTIQIRVTEGEKRAINFKASQMYMSLSEYIVHAAICFEMTEKQRTLLEEVNKAQAQLKEDIAKLAS